MAADPTDTNYTFSQCEGSATPYPTDIESVAYPDSLTPVFINHVGRHGARYPASAANSLKLQRLLSQADSLGTLTPLGRELQKVNDRIISLSENRWGALDSLGMAEQVGIATRMFYNFTEVFGSATTVDAISSYSPRAMMSMYCFTHQLDRLNNRLTFITSTGRINSPLMRPFDLAQDYLDFRKAKTWEAPYNEYFNAACPVSAIERVMGKYPFENAEQERDAAFTEYSVLAGLQSMGLPSQMEKFFTIQEANKLWSCFNLKQYLQRAASTISEVPAQIASNLVQNLIETTDAFVDGIDTSVTARLRFGHAETLMPLLSLLKIPGCNYLTNYFDTVALHWCDFDIVPMAANFQMIVFKSKNSGRYYVRVDVNEKPVKLRKGDDEIYYPWGELRRYMTNCLPLF